MDKEVPDVLAFHNSIWKDDGRNGNGFSFRCISAVIAKAADAIVAAIDRQTKGST